GFETVRSRIFCPEVRASSIARVRVFGLRLQFVRWENIDFPVGRARTPVAPPTLFQEKSQLLWSWQRLSSPILALSGLHQDDFRLHFRRQIAVANQHIVQPVRLVLSRP